MGAVSQNCFYKKNFEPIGKHREKVISYPAKERNRHMAHARAPASQGFRQALQDEIAHESEKDVDLRAGFRSAEGSYAPERSLEELEKQLYGPARLVQGRNRCGSQVEAVRQVFIDRAVVRFEDHEADLMGHFGGGGAESDDLVGENSHLLVPSFYALRGADPKCGVLLHPGDEEDPAFDHLVEHGVNDVATVNDICPPLLQKDLEAVPIVNSRGGDDQGVRKPLGKVQNQVQLAGSDRLAVIRPDSGEDAVDDGRVNGCDLLEPLELPRDVLRKAGEEVRKDLAKDLQSPRTVHGLGEGREGNSADFEFGRIVDLLYGRAHRWHAEEVVEQPAENVRQNGELRKPALLPVARQRAGDRLSDRREELSEQRAGRAQLSAVPSMPMAPPAFDLLGSSLALFPAPSCFADLPQPARISLPFLATFGDTVCKHWSVPSCNTACVIGRSRPFSLAPYAVNSGLI